MSHIQRLYLGIGRKHDMSRYKPPIGQILNFQRQQDIHLYSDILSIVVFQQKLHCLADFFDYVPVI